MLLLIILIILLTIVYNWLLIDYYREWRRTCAEQLFLHVKDLPFLSIVIVSRNETQLTSCILSIINGSYPIDRYEIIVVDDHSEDGSIEDVTNLQIQNVSVIHLHTCNIPDNIIAYKKYGQQIAIAKAKYDWIVTTDGDCLCPKEWLKTIALYSKGYSLITGPIKMTGSSNWLTRLQQFDVIGTMIGTSYGIHKKFWYSANAANMAFEKRLYLDYKEHAIQNSYASGDDIFLIQYAAKRNQPVGFVNKKAAVVETPAENTWTSFYNQRLRWASKSSAYEDRGMQALIYAIGFYNLTLLITLIWGVFNLQLTVLIIVLLAYLSKSIAEYLLFSSSSSFFGSDYKFHNGLVLSGLYIIYIVVIGFASIFISNYNWKGRKVR
ncbi:MAG: biofilm PGA synthesis N-glycosyltransferase PgaC [Saprospiraceae bacterium]